MAAGHHDTFEHVRDSRFFELPGHTHLELPAFNLFGYEFHLTKFMVLQVVAAILTFLIFRGLSRRIGSGQPARGAFWNFWETVALFIRDEVVRPTIGEGHAHHGDYLTADCLLPPETPLEEYEQFHPANPHVIGASQPFGPKGDITAAHHADQYLPFIWSCFFYVLFCNLLGMIPWLGSPTGNIYVTGTLAVCAFAFVLMQGMAEMGAVGFWKAQVPDMGVEGIMKLLLVPLVWTIEVLGLFIKHSVLAVRLFANIMAGHTVLGVLLGFLLAVAGTGMWWPVMAGSVLGQVIVSCLELLFAFIQAYIFAFLTTVFISMATHPH